MNNRRLLLVGLLSLVSASSVHADISPLSFNDFEDGTVQEWTRGNQITETNPINVATGGPQGANDNFLRIDATGIPDVPGGRLVSTNSVNFGDTQAWTGDYLAARVIGINVDLINLNSTALDLDIRFAVSNDAGAMTGFVTNDVVVLAAGAGWSNHTFSFLEADMDNDIGLSYDEVFQSIETIRVLDNPLQFYAGAVRGQPVALGMDNVRILTAAIPEPSTLAFLSFGGMLVAGRRRRSV